MDIENTLLGLFNDDDFPEDHFDLKKAFEGKRIILYGAGESSIWFFEIVRDIFGFSPTLILDKRFQTKQKHEGVDAISPENYCLSDADKTNSVVVVCTGKESLQQEIMSTLTMMGFSNIIKLRDIYEIHNPFSQPPQLIEEGFSFYKERKQHILSAFKLLDDELSKQVFLHFLQTHMQRKPVKIENSPREEQYFPKDITFTQGYSRFVSCGAYDGDTIRLLNQQEGKVDEIVCLEAEPAIFSRLRHFLQEHADALANKITALPCAVFDDEKQLKFTSSTGLGSRISQEGDAIVQCVALDHVLPDLKPTFISMDIEGAEPFALRGAEEMIRKHQPDLGICVYHSPDHLWEIVLYLNSLGLGYRFYLRNYTSFTIETVLYATVA